MRPGQTLGNRIPSVENRTVGSYAQATWSSPGLAKVEAVRADPSANRRSGAWRLSVDGASAFSESGQEARVEHENGNPARVSHIVAAVKRDREAAQ